MPSLSLYAQQCDQKVVYIQDQKAFPASLFLVTIQCCDNLICFSQNIIIYLLDVNIINTCQFPSLSNKTHCLTKLYDPDMNVKNVCRAVLCQWVLLVKCLKNGIGNIHFHCFKCTRSIKWVLCRYIYAVQCTSWYMSPCPLPENIRENH